MSLSMNPIRLASLVGSETATNRMKRHNRAERPGCLQPFADGMGPLYLSGTAPDKTDSRALDCHEIGRLEANFQGKLNDSWTGTDANDTTEITGSKDASGDGIDATAGRDHSADVADGIVAICMVEQVEEVRTELEAGRFANRPAFEQREIYAALAWPSQRVPADVSNVRSHITRQHALIMCTRNWLPRLHDGHGECGGVEVVARRDVAHRSLPARAWRPVGASSV